MIEVAKRTACDIGTANQEACSSARVVYVLCGTDQAGLEKINALGELVYRELLALPPYLSTPPLQVSRELLEQVEVTRLDDTFFRVIGRRRRTVQCDMMLERRG